MKIIKPGFEIWNRDEQRGGLAIIERAGRACYKTEDKATDESAEAFVAGLIKRQHLSVLEHGDYIFQVEDEKMLDNIEYGMRRWKEETGQTIRLFMTREMGRYIISGNVRAWRELIASTTLAALYFDCKIDPLYIAGLPFDDEHIDDPRVKRLQYSDLAYGIERLIHERMTVKFTIDRGVSHEFVRNRGNQGFGFSQESTRYCNYSQERFGKEITVIEPCFLTKHTEPYDLWKRSCMSDEVEYFSMLNFGCQPQEARCLLPHSTKTELVMTGSLGDWNHFFDLRARRKTGMAHPQAEEVAQPLLLEANRRYPGIFLL